MRQAGRYLPEYRAIAPKGRKLPRSLLHIRSWRPRSRCSRSAVSASMRRSCFPISWWCRMRSASGALRRGRRAAARCARRPIALGALRPAIDHAVLAPVYEAIRAGEARLAAADGAAGLLRGALDRGDLHGRWLRHAGPGAARLFAYRDPEAFGQLIDLWSRLRPTIWSAVRRRRRCGADFRYLGGRLPAGEFERWCIEPVARIVAARRKADPGRANHRFSRAAPGANFRVISTRPRSMRSGSIGRWTRLARDQVPERRPVQGNLDPLALVAGGARADRAIDAILEAFARGPLIFNLGHGILPDTPIAHVERLLGACASAR